MCPQSRGTSTSNCRLNKPTVSNRLDILQSLALVYSYRGNIERLLYGVDLLLLQSASVCSCAFNYLLPLPHLRATNGQTNTEHTVAKEHLSSR